MTAIPPRRRLRFHTLDQIMGDAMLVGSGNYERLGNWSLGQCCDHLAAIMDYCIDGFPFSVPLPLRIIGPTLKKRMIDPDRGFPTGVKFPKSGRAALEPNTISDEQGLAKLQASIDRLKTEPNRARSPLFGTMTRDEWNMLHCNHAALHLSYLMPVGRDDPASNATRV